METIRNRLIWNYEPNENVGTHLSIYEEIRKDNFPYYVVIFILLEYFIKFNRKILVKNILTLLFQEDRRSLFNI